MAAQQPQSFSSSKKWKQQQQQSPQQRTQQYISGNGGNKNGNNDSSGNSGLDRNIPRTVAGETSLRATTSVEGIRAETVTAASCSDAAPTAVYGNWLLT
jgi:hypothetical protein